MWEIADVKARGRAAFKANYWPCVGAGLLLMLLTMGTTVSSRTSVGTDAASDTAAQQASDGATSAFNALPDDQKAAVAGVIFGGLAIIIIVSVLLKIFVFNPLQVGAYRFFRKNIEDTSTSFSTILEGFGDYGRTFITLFLRDLFLMLWTLLLIIPGIIKSYSYMMVPFIVKDEPNLSPTQVIDRSKKMMQGNKGRAFLMDLTFLGWALLGLITFNLGNIFWTTPYYTSTRAALYLELSGARGGHMR